MSSMAASTAASGRSPEMSTAQPARTSPIRSSFSMTRRRSTTWARRASPGTVPSSSASHSAAPSCWSSAECWPRANSVRRTRSRRSLTRCGCGCGVAHERGAQAPVLDAGTFGELDQSSEGRGFDARRARASATVLPRADARLVALGIGEDPERSGPLVADQPTAGRRARRRSACPPRRGAPSRRRGCGCVGGGAHPSAGTRTPDRSGAGRRAPRPGRRAYSGGHSS